MYVAHFTVNNIMSNTSTTEKLKFSITKPKKPFSVNNLKTRLHSVIVPASIRSMGAKLKMRYEYPTSEIASDVNCLFISSNASKTNIPYWDSRSNKFDFELASPSVSLDGRLAEPYYTFFIPDFLIQKWWKTDRKTIEDNLGTQQGIKVFRKDNNTGLLSSVPIITDKVVNYSMGGLLVKIDIHAISW